MLVTRWYVFPVEGIKVHYLWNMTCLHASPVELDCVLCYAHVKMQFVFQTQKHNVYSAINISRS